MNDLLILALLFAAVLVIRRIILSLMASGEDAVRKARIASNDRSANVEEQPSLAERYVKSKQDADPEKGLHRTDDYRGF